MTTPPGYRTTVSGPQDCQGSWAALAWRAGTGSPDVEGGRKESIGGCPWLCSLDCSLCRCLRRFWVSRGGTEPTYAHRRSCLARHNVHASRSHRLAPCFSTCKCQKATGMFSKQTVRSRWPGLGKQRSRIWKSVAIPVELRGCGTLTIDEGEGGGPPHSCKV